MSRKSHLVRIREMTESDLGGADELRRLVGWNQTREDWLRMLRLSPRGCFVAVDDGVVLGTVTTTPYRRELAWIGMMLVHPEHRRQGIARRLMQRALDSLAERRIPCVKLDATPAGLPLYEQLGFIREWDLTRHERLAQTASSLEVPSADVRSLTDEDWEAVATLDARVFGVSRGELLRGLADHSLRALVWPARGAVQGWGLLRPGANADYLGPVVCLGETAACAMVAALVQSAGRRTVFWDVPDSNELARRTARELGFTPVRPLFRMRYGPDKVSGDPALQIAIADPAVG